MDGCFGGHGMGKRVSSTDSSDADKAFTPDSCNPLPDLKDPNKIFNPINLALVLVREFW